MSTRTSTRLLHSKLMRGARDRVAAMGVAAGLDVTLSEPPARVHPVRAIGWYLHVVGRQLPATPPSPAVGAGGLAWAFGAAGSVALAAAVERVVGHGPPWRRRLVLGAALWPLFSQRLLLDEVAAVEAALAHDLQAGRETVARLVSRDVSSASATEVRQAAIESLGENLSDSVVAPLLWFAVGGLPAAALYRFANTADATWGYRTQRWRHAGLVAARADDLLNLVPARLTGLLLTDRRIPLAALRREARHTPSPNAGWPMAALALRLDIRLRKAGTYMLNASGREPTPSDTFAALRVAERRSWLAAGLCAAVVLGVGAGRTLLARRRSSCRR